VLACLDNAAKRPRYVGRKAAASPASGLAKVFAAEQAALVNEALSV
jgi:2-oxoglutarate dehydrogenase E1 component